MVNIKLTVLTAFVFYSCAVPLYAQVVELDTLRLNKIREMPDDTIKLRAYYDYLQYLNAQNPYYGRKMAPEVYAAAQRVGDEYWEAIIGLECGNYYRLGLRPDTALTLIEAALPKLKNTAPRREYLSKRHYRSLALMAGGQEAEAIADARKMIDESRAINYREGEAKAYAAIGMIQLSMRNRPEYKRFWKKALSIAEEVGDDEVLMKINHWVSRNHYNYNELDSVMAPLLASRAAARRIDNLFGVMETYAVEAALYTMEENYEKALAAYDTLQIISPNEELRISDLGNRAWLYTQMGRFEEAGRDYALVSEAIRSSGSIEGLAQLNGSMDTYYVATNQMDSAYYNMEEWKNTMDTIYQLKQERAVAEMAEKYEAADREAEIARQNVEIARHRNRTYFIGGGLLLALILGIVFFRLSRRLGRRNQEVEKLLGEKETLIREIHHRVKNNLQVISSLLQLQSRELSDEGALGALRESQSRVQAMGLIHQKLYQGTEMTVLSMPEYLYDLGETLLDAYQLEESVEIIYDVENIELDADTAIPLGLIVNELVTNALKYAFPNGREGIIELGLYRQDGQLELLVQDDGVGKKAAPVLKSSTSFGGGLVELLTQKIGGAVSHTEEAGYGVKVRFPEASLPIS